MSFSYVSATPFEEQVGLLFNSVMSQLGFKDTCDHEQFAKGPGCIKYINIEAGGLLRVLLDRDPAAYKDIYRQRTSAERINSEAKALGIERPKVCNERSVHPLNTLTYIVINVQALARVCLTNARAASPTVMLC